MLKQIEAEIAGCGYTIQPFLDSSEVEAVMKLHRDSNPVVSADFYHSAFGSAETRLLVDDGIRSIVQAKIEELLPGYRVVTSSFVVKKALSTLGKLALHQDASVVDHDTHLGLNVWVPLCQVDVRNGCLRMVAHSQKFGRICAIPPNPSPYAGLRSELESNYLTDVPMTAGNACVFDTRVLHATDENFTQHDRIAVQLSLVPVGVTPRLYFWNSVAPLRLEVYNVDREFVMNLRVQQYPNEAEKKGASFVGVIDYTPAPWSRAELVEKIPLPQKADCASIKRSWLNHVFAFGSQP